MPVLPLRVAAVAASLTLGLLVLSCSEGGGSRGGDQAPTVTEPHDAAPEPAPRLEWAIAIHGGAGVIARRSDEESQPYYTALAEALRAGSQALAEGRASLEVVEMVVELLEDDPKFNAGRGAVFTNQGTHELDAAIMDGRTLAAGAVAGVRNVRNPIELARQVLERSPHVLLAGAGADDFAREVKVRRVPQDYFSTDERMRQWQEARKKGSADDKSTVGAVALDRFGNLAAATSTGGLTNKRYGRIGDVPIIGAGTYANNETAAISCTGKGEEFIRHTVAYDITARMAYRGATLQQAAEEVIHQVLSAGDGGMIGVDHLGNVATVFNTPGMFRGVADATGRFEVGIWDEVRNLAESPAATQ